MSTLRHALGLAAKDLRQEWRAPHALTLTVMTGVLMVVVLALGLGPTGAAHAGGAGAILWTAFLFAGALCFEKTMSAEREDDALSALLLAPIDRSAIFFGKFLSNLVLVIALVLVVTPVGVVLLRLDISGVWAEFSAVAALSVIGFSAAGTLFAGLLGGSRRGSGVLALALLALSLPLVLVSTQLIDRIVARAPASGPGVPVLVAFDAVFLVAGWLAFEPGLESRGAT